MCVKVFIVGDRVTQLAEIAVTAAGQEAGDGDVVFAGRACVGGERNLLADGIGKIGFDHRDHRRPAWWRKDHRVMKRDGGRRTRSLHLRRRTSSQQEPRDHQRARKSPAPQGPRHFRRKFGALALGVCKTMHHGRGSAILLQRIIDASGRPSPLAAARPHAVRHPTAPMAIQWPRGVSIPATL